MQIFGWDAALLASGSTYRVDKRIPARNRTHKANFPATIFPIQPHRHSLPAAGKRNGRAKSRRQPCSFRHAMPRLFLAKIPASRTACPTIWLRRQSPAGFLNSDEAMALPTQRTNACASRSVMPKLKAANVAAENMLVTSAGNFWRSNWSRGCGKRRFFPAQTRTALCQSDGLR